MKKSRFTDSQIMGALKRDDQFDLSDALIAIAISLLAVASLTQLSWLFALSLVPAGFGALMGVAGLVGLGIHPDLLIKLLSCPGFEPGEYERSRCGAACPERKKGS